MSVHVPREAERVVQAEIRERPRTDWITTATIYGAAALTTVGFVVASIVDAVLDRGRGR